MTEVPEHLLKRAQAAKEKAMRVDEQQVVFVTPAKPVPPTPPPKNPELTNDEREWLRNRLMEQKWHLDQVDIVRGILGKLSNNHRIR